MDASEVLTKAWAAVVESGVPPEMQETAFKAAVALIAPAGPVTPATAPRPQQPAVRPANEGDTTDQPAAAPEAAPVDTDALFKTLASESGIDESALIEVFFFDADGTPHINAPGRKLGSSMTAKVQNIATGLAGVRFYVSDLPSMPVEIVRAEATTKSAYDVNNFGKHISSVPGVTVSGSGSSRVLRVKQNEIEAAFRAMVNTARGIPN